MAEDLKPKGKIFTPDYEEETKLPDGVYWENLIDKPMTLAEMSKVVGSEVNLFQDGNIRVSIGYGQINFFTPDGIYSGSLMGLGTNKLMMSVDDGVSYEFGKDTEIPGAITLGSYEAATGPETYTFQFDGTIYYDSTNNRFRAKKNGSWYTITLA